MGEVHEKQCDDGSEPPTRPGNRLQGPAQFRADLDLVRDQFPAGVFRAGGQRGRPWMGIPEVDPQQMR
jgi:hypothetical protein